MEDSLLKQLAVSLSKLQASHEKGSNINQDVFNSSVLSYIRADGSIEIERYKKLKDVFNFKSPLIIACKNNGFWQAVERPNEIDHSPDRVHTRKKSSRHSSTDKNSIGVCGSPLKLDIIADLSVFEDDEGSMVNASSKRKSVDFGLPLATVRKLMFLFSSLASNSKNVFESEKAEFPTILALCDGQNIRGVSAIALKPIVDDQNNFLGLKITDSVSKPPAEKAVHAKMLPNFSNTVEITCQAKYDIHVMADFSLENASFIQLELNWKIIPGQSFLMLHEPPLQAKTVARIRNYLGNPESRLSAMYQELEVLRTVIEGLETTEVNWIGTNEQPLVEDVKKLVEQLKLGSDIVDIRHGETTRATDDDGEAINLDMVEERKDLDFTDLLWKILQGCTSYMELIETLKYIVGELRKGDLQPFIHSYNNTTVGQMVKDSYRGQLRDPVLTGLGPLQYMAEMGVQKLTRDYVHMFLSKNLANMGMLDFFLKGNLELEEKLNRLRRLQDTLETVMMLNNNLTLPHESLAKCCREMLKFYETNQISSSHSFTFSVPSAYIRNVFDKFAPTEWSVWSQKKVGSFFAERLAYHFTAEQAFDWVQMEVDAGRSTSTGDEEEPSYFLTILRDSVSILA
ncbi:protein zwilch homolog [Dreissena polymorpha]|nr:protein zwilch homolog [Dreissena polymorpha]